MLIPLRHRLERLPAPQRREELRRVPPAASCGQTVASMHGDGERVPLDGIGPAIRIIYDALVETARKR